MNPARHPLPLPEAATNSKGLPLEVGGGGRARRFKSKEERGLPFISSSLGPASYEKSLSTNEAQPEAVPLLRSSNQKDSSSRQPHENVVNLWMAFISIQKARRPFWPGSASRDILGLPKKAPTRRPMPRCLKRRAAPRSSAQGNLQKWVQTW